MKLSEWARNNGVRYETAWRWFKDGKLPVPATQLATGTILVDVPVKGPSKAALYARVSSPDQKGDLDRQLARLATYAAKEGLLVVRTVTEVGSGMNGHRPQLAKLLSDASVDVIVAEHRDRVARFGSEYVEAALRANGRRLLIADPDEMKDDLVQDMVDVLTSFCARLYGPKSARSRAERVMKLMEGDEKEGAVHL